MKITRPKPIHFRALQRAEKALQKVIENPISIAPLRTLAVNDLGHLKSLEAILLQVYVNKTLFE